MNSAVRKASSPYRRWIGNLSLVLLSLVGVCLVAEMLLMAVVPDPIIWLDPQESYVHDPELIHRLKPNQQSFTHSVPVHTNSFGLRNGEFSLQPGPNTFRVLCLGDSLTFGNGVRLEDTYPKQLELLLNSRRPGRYEVINAGVPAYDTWQEVDYLKQYGWQFMPKLVVIGFYANDVAPRPANIPQLIDSSGFPRKPGLTGLMSYRFIHLLKRSRLLLLLRDRFNRLMNRLSPSAEYQRQSSLLNGTTDAFLQRGWKEIDRSFAELSNLSKKHGFDVLVATFPMAEQVVHHYPKAGYPSKVIEIADKHRLRAIDLSPVFAKNFRGFGSLFIEWDGHPNANAFRITAREIARHMSAGDMRPE